MVSNERGKPEIFDMISNTLLQEEVKPGPLFRARWHRIVLDEAHYIKNRNSGQSLACADLVGKKRFCLTGTPIQNSADELYSLFRFLRIPHFKEYAYFNDKIGRHIKVSKDMTSRQTLLGMTRLQAVMKSCLLRRTKQSKKRDGVSNILTLPKRIVTIVEVPFTEPERWFYDALQGFALVQFERYDAANAVMKNFHHVLLMILRLRQASCHPHLVREVFEEFAAGGGGGVGERGIHRIMGGRGRKGKGKGKEGGGGVEGRRVAAAVRNSGGGGSKTKRLSLGAVNRLRQFGVKLEDEDLYKSSDEENSDVVVVGETSGAKRKAVGVPQESPMAKKLRVAKGVMSADVFDRVYAQVNSEEGGFLDAECPHCLDVLEDPVVTTCGHGFCLDCITGYLEHKPANEQQDGDDDENVVRPCPVCRGDISRKTLTE
ncbi:hypothetical protein HDU98_005795, partial [Podochytrium sp. JEL0797]